MRISDWSSDVCSSDLGSAARLFADAPPPPASYRAMRKGAAITPADVLSEDALAGADLLILAQPRALNPVELLVVDEWVRAGGRALLFADPALHWAGELPQPLHRPDRKRIVQGKRVWGCVQVGGGWLI